MLKVVASEQTSSWEAGLLEEGTGPCHPDPQGNVWALTVVPSLRMHCCNLDRGWNRGGGGRADWVGGGDPAGGRPESPEHAPLDT